MISLSSHQNRRIVASLLGGLAVLASGATEARAGFTVALAGNAPVVVSPGVFQYNYVATTATDDQVNPGNFFRVYDFAGLVPGTVAAPAGWTASISNANPTPPPNVILSHGDDPAVPNLTFTYAGATPILGPTTITGFSAQSTVGTTGVKDFVGRLTKTSTGTVVDSVGDVQVPSAVPEPSSLISGSIGVIALGFLYGCRSRRKIQAAAA